MSVTLESAVFMEKNYSDNWHSIKKSKDLTLKQMFNMSAKLVSEQDEISVEESYPTPHIHEQKTTSNYEKWLRQHQP